MAKAKRARRNSFRTMSDDGALEALEMIERVVPEDRVEERKNEEPSDEADEAAEDEA